MPFDRQTILASPTGAHLNLYWKNAKAPARIVVQINHGLAEHGARYAHFAEFLAEHGCHVYAHDHRGHGLTTAPDAPQGRFGQTDGGLKVLADVEAVHDLIAGEHPNLPVIIFGHSMGGLIALNFALRNARRLHGAAIWNANFSAGAPAYAALAVLAWERFRLGADVPSRLLPKLTFQAWGKAIPDHRTLFDWLSRDAAEVDAYIADPLCGWDASISLWRDLFGFIMHGANNANFSGMAKNLPINLVGGESDPATNGGKAVSQLAARMRKMAFSNVDMKIYTDTRHESLNEINRATVMNDFAAWIDRTLK